MNRKSLLAFILLSLSTISMAQIKEEKLILDRKRVPEVKRIEKKKTSVPSEKNYPPEEKSNEVIDYQIQDVPVLSDFQPSTIQGEDVSPKLGNQYQRNYFRLGYGNYNQFLADGSISGNIQDNLEVGADVHYTSNEGLKNEYAWKSEQKDTKLTGFLNHYGDLGKTNVTTNIKLHDFNWYGVNEFQPDADTDFRQTYSQFDVNAHYDFYSKNILNSVDFTSSFLKDRFNANESQVNFGFNLSKYEIEFGQDLKLNLDLGTGVQLVNTNFKELTQNQSKYFNGHLTPKVTFQKGDSYLMLGSEFSFLNGSTQSNLLNEQQNGRFYWFPKVEVLLGVSPEIQFYGGVDGGLKMNTYESLLNENPYLVPDLSLKPTETKYQFYVGIKGTWEDQLKYDVNAKFGKLNNMVFYKANSLFDDELYANRVAYDFLNTYHIAYHNGSLSEVEANLHYNPISNLQIDGGLKFQKFNLDHQAIVYNKPLVQMSIGANYAMLDKKLNLGAKAFFVSDRTTNVYTLQPNPLIAIPNYNISEAVEHKVGGYADINLSAEYRIHKNFSIFALANNLVGAKYQTYNGYKVLGTQILGGVKVRF